MRIYVAGSYSNPNVIEVFYNMRRGMRASSKLFQKEFSPFCPWSDFHFILSAETENPKFTLENFYRYSIDWLSVSEAVLVLPESENSVGTQNEIRLAKELGIPVYYTIEELEINARK